jgi:hypothetical protein
MARRVFVHIGTMKSATTYVQELGARNSSQLRERGVYWVTGERPFLAVGDLLDRHEHRPGSAGAWTDLVREIAQFPGDVVLSNERLAPLGGGRIRRVVAALAPAEINVVVTARDLSRVIPSHWQETLKNGDSTPWSTFAAAVCAEPVGDANVARKKDIGTWFWRRHDVARIVTRWQQHVPRSATVVTVPPRGSDPRIVADRFAAAIGVDSTALLQPEYDNSTVGAYSAELLRRLNETAPQLEREHFTWGVKDALVRRALSNRAADEPAFGLTPQQHEWVRLRAERMVAELRATSTCVLGDLDDLRPADGVPTAAVDPSSATDADLVRAALEGLAGMVNVVATLQRELQQAAPARLATPPIP